MDYYKKNLAFPDIRNALYIGSSFSEIRNTYVRALRESGNIYHSLYANKLEECANMLSTANLNELESEFHDFKEHMRMWAKKRHIKIILKRRQKDFLGLNEKIRLFLKTGKSLDKIQDLLGFRIILCTPKPDTMQSIELCYEVLNELIKFFALKKHCIFLEAEPTVNTFFRNKNIPNIFIPKESMVLPGFENNIKDYIVHPKKNGYQSLHMLIKKSNGLIFEVQIRTFAMDLHAEYGSAHHLGHKNSRYKISENSDYLEDIMNIDYSKITLPGFSVLEDGTVHDLVGLTMSIDPFNAL